ncbi:MAG: response regulator, partial [Pirellulales bacterium]
MVETPEQTAPRIDPTTFRILIVDNDKPHAEAVAESLQRVGYQCEVATSGPAGQAAIEQHDFDVVITDLVMNDVDGLAILRLVQQNLPGAQVIMVTGHGTIASAVEAMREGAFNYLPKPLDLNHLRTVTEKAIEQIAVRRHVDELQRRLDERFGFEGVVGNSPQMNAVIDKLKRIAPTDASV